MKTKKAKYFVPKPDGEQHTSIMTESDGGEYVICETRSLGSDFDLTVAEQHADLACEAFNVKYETGKSPRQLMEEALEKFPNGFESWMETHHEIVAGITLRVQDLDRAPIGLYDLYDKHGTGGMYELAEELTDKFEKQYKGKEWDGEYFDVIEEFIATELKKL